MNSTDDKIFIIGAGAIGRSLAGFLIQMGKDVVLLRGQIKNQTPQPETITIQLSDGTVLRNDVIVSTISNYPMLSGIIVLATKSYGNKQIAEDLNGKTGDTPIVVMQNGLEIEKAFTDKGFPEIYRCILFTSCQIAENHIRFKPVSSSPIGVIRGNEDRLSSTVESLNNPYLVFQAEKNIYPIMWTKAIINSVFNSVCPLLEVDNGIFYRNERVLHIAKSIIQECISIAATEGIDLSTDKVLERLLLISRTSDGQLISTYQDLLYKRKTEIETLNLAIARKAEEIDLGSHVIMTKVLGELVDIKSELLRSSICP